MKLLPIRKIVGELALGGIGTFARAFAQLHFAIPVVPNTPKWLKRFLFLMNEASSLAITVLSPRSHDHHTTLPPPTPTKPRELAPFLKQLREMLETESPSILRWTPDGRAFEILDLHQMTHVVLPKYFKHAKYASFQRQLNYFNFRKWTKSKSPRCTFANPHFVRGAPELTWHITRKRDVSHRKKRQRAQSFDPEGSKTLVPGTIAQVSSREPENTIRDRAGSESLSYGLDLRTQALLDDHDDRSDGLLEWIDDQFPSIASLELLDATDDPIAPVWTPYVPESIAWLRS